MLRGSHSASTSPIRPLRAASASHADPSPSWTTPAALSKDIFSASTAIGGGGGHVGAAVSAGVEREQWSLGAPGGFGQIIPLPVPPITPGGAPLSVSASRAAVAVRAMNVGTGVPVVRRHSYTTGMGPKPRCVEGGAVRVRVF